jgi:Zn finger protein HypA/HybF involved in hydrogenase expression
MPSVIICRKCYHERETNMPQLEDSVICPHCGIHGHMTMSNCDTIYLKSGLRMFIPLN